MRTQLARFRIDDRELLFNPESERMVLHSIRGRKTSADFADLHRLFLNRGNQASVSSICENLRNLWTSLSRVRLTSASSPPLAGTCPSLNCRDRGRARALCGSPFPKLLRPPTRSWPDRSTRLRNPGLDCKSQWQPARHRAPRTPRCSDRNREIDSIVARPPRPVAEFPWVRATPFGNANETDCAARRA